MATVMATVTIQMTNPIKRNRLPNGYLINFKKLKLLT